MVWDDRRLVDRPELELNADLFDAVHKITGITPTIAEPVVVLSAYVYALSQGYGLSDSMQLTENQFDRVELPASAAELINHVFADNAATDLRIDGTSIGDHLYDVFVDLAEDPSVRKAINRSEPLSEIGMLKVVQVFWNLEATSARPRLPLTAGPLRSGKGADIKVPGADRDFAVMTWAARVKEGVDGLGSGRATRSSGQGLRKKGARFAVLAAQRLLDRAASPLPTDDGATLEVNVPDSGNPTARIVWPNQ